MIARLTNFCLAAALLLQLSACSTLQGEQPMAPHVSVRPAAPARAPQQNGAIFQTAMAGPTNPQYRPLFEDLRARHVGDTIVIQLNERTAASKNASSSASKTNDVEFGIPALKGLPGKTLLGSELEANSSNKFQGQGASAANNEFSGTIAVTVVEVLPNGNLLVSGEKQIAINQGEEFIRFSGVVNPTTIGAANSVSSTQVADARIEYRGKGYINQAQKMGWLSRFFLSVLPF
jgi:flagellar L-ring protein precursor FlgH